MSVFEAVLGGFLGGGLTCGVLGYLLANHIHSTATTAVAKAAAVVAPAKPAATTAATAAS